MNVKNIPYFAFKCSAWDSERKRIRIKSEDIYSLTGRLEKGENIYETIPELSPNRFTHFQMSYGIFETREEVIISNERFISESGFKEVGKLILPHYRVFKFNGEEMEKYNDNVMHGTLTGIDGIFEGALCYIDTGEIKPVDFNRTVVLNENQLRFPEIAAR